MEWLVLFLGHIVVGFIFGLKAIMDDKELTEQEIEKIKADTDIPEHRKDDVIQLSFNKIFVLTVCSILGYFNFYFLIMDSLFKKKD